MSIQNTKSDEVSNKSLRIVMNDLSVGGTETHLSRVLPLLAEYYGWQITVILLSKKLSLLDKLTKVQGISVLYPELFPIFKKLLSEQSVLYRCFETIAAFFLLLSNFIRDRRSITQYFLPKPYLMGGLVAFLTGLPAKQCMGRRSLNDYQKKYRWALWLEKKWHQRMNVITANSDKIVQQLVDEEGVKPNTIVKIYNGVDDPDCKYIHSRLEYREQLIKSYGLPSNAWILIVVANLIPYKGHLDLLSACSAISEQEAGGRPWHLLCVGFDNGYGQILREAADRYGISKQVHWLGRQSDVLALYAASDIGILPPYGNEGFSNSILEGMSIGLPMIVTDVGGNAEAVVNEQTGLIVPAKAPEALRAAIVRLFKHPELVTSYGESGRVRVKEAFSLRECVLNYNRFYEGLLEEQQHGH